MGKGRKEITDLKCRDCAECVLTGWWDRSKICKVSGFPVDQDSDVCILFVEKRKPNATR